MDLSEIKNQLNNWLDNRLNNPYFGAVVAVWVVSNRVLVFGLFNFDPTFNLAQRIAFVHQRLEGFDRLSCLWGFHGFYATLVWASVWGLVVMLFFDQVNTMAKALYKIGHKSKNYILNKIEPDKWIEKTDYEIIQKSAIELEDDLKNKRVDINRIQKEYDAALESLSKAKKGNDEKDFIINTNQKLIDGFQEEKNKFRILYAQYGTEEEFKEVTKIVSELISKEGKLSIDNQSLGGDPSKYRIKKFFAEYEFNNKAATINANELEVVEFIDNRLVNSKTPESINLQKMIENLNKLNILFKGEWSLTYTKDKKTETEKVKVDNTGKYFANDNLRFYIHVLNLDGENLKISKINTNKTEHSIENLIVQNDKLITGSDNLGFTLEYRKSVKSKLLLLNK